MSRLLLAILPVLFLQTARYDGAQTSESATASIEGVVLRAGTNEPIEDAQVSVYGERTDGTRLERRQIYTDTAGRFRLKSLDAGRYKLTFASNGYVQRSYPESNLLTLEDGQAVRNLAIPLTPTGAVSGRITDRNSEPLAHIPVQLMRLVYDNTGRRQLKLEESTDTDDRGEYRLFYVTPGTYYLYAGNASGDPGNDRREEQFHDPFAYAFFPGVSDSRQATAIVVDPGAERRGIDMTLEAPARYRVRGGIVDARTGKAPESPNISLSFYDPLLPLHFNAELLSGEAGSYADGRFEFRGVMPGTFTVSASVAEEPPEKKSNQSLSRVAIAGVTVVDKDVENVIITIPDNASIAGAWRRETPPAPQTRPPTVALLPQTQMPAGFQLAEGIGNDDGTLVITHASPGEYRLTSTPRQPGGYLKEARFNGEDVLYRSFRILGNETGGLEVVFGVTNAVVEGAAIAEDLKPFSSATVVLVPKQRDKTALFRSTTTDMKGQFRFTNVIPGEYDVFAWYKIDPYGYFDPDVLAQASRETRETPAVTVTESSTIAVNLTVRNRP